MVIYEKRRIMSYASNMQLSDYSKLAINLKSDEDVIIVIMTSSSEIFNKFRLRSKFHVNTITGSRVSKTFVYKEFN